MKSCFLTVCGVAFALASQARAAEPAIIGLARSFLGSEADLDAVKSVHMVGRLVKGAANDPKTQVTAQVDIVFEKPFRESLTMVLPVRFIHTALDNYEAWQQVQSPVSPGQTAVDPVRNSQLTLLDADQTKVLRVDTLENLLFYRGAERLGGAIEDRGPATVDGIACEKVVFIYSPAIVYARYFDRATGRLVYSETIGGVAIREHGDITAGGIRFPKTIDAVEKDAAGRAITSTYTFDKVTINGSFPDSLFAVPLLPPVAR